MQNKVYFDADLGQTMAKACPIIEMPATLAVTKFFWTCICIFRAFIFITEIR